MHRAVQREQKSVWKHNNSSTTAPLTYNRELVVVASLWIFTSLNPSIIVDDIFINVIGIYKSTIIIKILNRAILYNMV